MADYRQVLVELSSLEDLIKSIVTQGKTLESIEPTPEESGTFPTMEIFTRLTEDYPGDSWPMYTDMMSENIIVAAVCMAFQDMGAKTVNFLDHEVPNEEDCSFEHWDKEWLMYSDDLQFVVYREYERNLNRAREPEHDYRLTVFHRRDRPMNRYAGFTSSGEAKETWQNKEESVSEIVERHIGWAVRDFKSDDIHKTFLERRLAIAQIGVLSSDILRRLSDEDHIWNVVSESLKRRGHHGHLNTDALWPSNE